MILLSQESLIGQKYIGKEKKMKFFVCCIRPVVVVVIVVNNFNSVFD